MPQFGKAIGAISEKAGQSRAKPKYPDSTILYEKSRERRPKEDTIESTLRELSIVMNKKKKETKNMQTKHFKERLSCILCIVLIVAMALFTTGCNGSKENGTPAASGENAGALTDSKAAADSVQQGEGSTVFSFTVVDRDGNETPFEIHTDKETVGDALLELGMIEGDESEYGLFVKTVNGITADYDTDGVYWAFYVNDEYAMAGVDSTTITEGDRYSFRIE